jgi:hypothetical protein
MSLRAQRGNPVVLKSEQARRRDCFIPYSNDNTFISNVPKILTKKGRKINSPGPLYFSLGSKVYLPPAGAPPPLPPWSPCF